MRSRGLDVGGAKVIGGIQNGGLSGSPIRRQRERNRDDVQHVFVGVGLVDDCVAQKKAIRKRQGSPGSVVSRPDLEDRRADETVVDDVAPQSRDFDTVADGIRLRGRPHDGPEHAHDQLLRANHERRCDGDH